MSTYQYDTLQSEPGKAEIRLLELEPGLKADVIRCNLHTVPLHRAMNYTALSYVWGEQAQKATITCGGHSLDIGMNLHSALRRFRDEKVTRMLWADALCINQKKESEKEHQVGIMRQIYEKAEETLIWLGEEEDDTCRAVRLVRTLNNVKRLRAENSDTRKFFELGVKGQESYYLPPMFNPAYKAFGALLSRDWFNRVWIIQELAVSKTPTVVCGNHEVSWDELFNAAEQAHELVLPIWDTSKKIQRLWELQGLRLMVRQMKSKTLLVLLLLSREFEATDSRDKVYALCGLANDCGSDALNIKPDYKIQVEELYKKVARQLLFKSADLDVLGVPRSPQTSKSLNLPTWVPDWTTADGSISLRFPGNTFDFQAGPEDTSKNVVLGQEGSEIGLSGFVVGHIGRIGDIHTHEGEEGLSFVGRINRVPKEQVVFNEWESISRARSGIKYAQTGEDILDAYWQTLIAGNLSAGFETAKAGFVMWDEAVRSKFRLLPTSKYLRWMNPVLALPLVVKMGVEMVWNGLPQGPLMGFRSNMTVATNRRLFRTKEGHIGLAPSLTKEGDCIAIFKGVKVPLVLRAAGTSSKWNLIGACYVHGIMHGEEFDGSKCTNIWIT